MNELEIMDQLRNIIISEYPNYVEEGEWVPSTEDILVDFPDVDTMKSNTAVFIDPNAVSLSDYTVEEDAAVFNLVLCIIAKRDTSASLKRKVFRMKDIIFRILRSNQSLDGMVDFTQVTGYNYYPELYAETGIVGMDIQIDINYTLDI